LVLAVSASFGVIAGFVLAVTCPARASGMNTGIGLAVGFAGAGGALAAGLDGAGAGGCAERSVDGGGFGDENGGRDASPRSPRGRCSRRSPLASPRSGRGLCSRRSPPLASPCSRRGRCS